MTTLQRLAVATLVLVLAALSWLLLLVLDHQAAHGNEQTPVRLIPPISFVRGPDRTPVPLPASRSFLRSALANPPTPTDPADQRAGGTQTSPVTADPSPAATTPGLDVRKGKAASRPGDSIRGRIAWCESRNNPRAVNRSSGASGLYQFLRSTWHAVTGLPGDAADYPETVQDHAFDLLYASSGTRPWASSKTCWSRP